MLFSVKCKAKTLTVPHNRPEQQTQQAIMPTVTSLETLHLSDGN